MTLTAEEAIDIVLNDEKYLRHVDSRSPRQNAAWTVLEIPRSSFTAFRLLYASPIELSVCSKVVLLGGVPSQWYQEQKCTIRSGLKRLKSSKARQRIDKLTNYASRAVYQTDPWEARRLLKEPSENIGTRPNIDSDKSNALPRIQNSKALRPYPTTMVDRTRNLRRNAHTFPFVPAVDLRRTPSKKNGPQLRVEPHVIGVVPSEPLQETSVLRHQLTEIEKTHENVDNYGNDGKRGDDIAYEGQHVPADIGAKPKKSSARHFQHCGVRSDDEQLRREQEQNEREMNKLLTTCYANESNQHAKSKETYTSVSSNSTEAGETDEGSIPSIRAAFPYAESTIQAEEALKPSDGDMNQILTFTLPDHLSSQKPFIANNLGSQEMMQSRQASVVFLKALATSKNFKKLSILMPEPEQNLLMQEGFVENGTKSSYKVHGQHLRSANEKTRGIFTKFKRKVAKKSGIYYSSQGLSDRSGPILMMDKILVMVKTAVTQRNPILNFSESEPIDTRVADRWKEYIVAARKTNRQDRPVLLQFCRGTFRWHENRHGQKPGSGNTLDFYLDKTCIVGLYSILDKTIFIEKPDDKFLDCSSEELHHLSDHYLSTLKFYIFRCRTSESSDKWNDFLQSAIGMNTIPGTISFRVPEAEVSFSVHLSQNLKEELAHIETQEKNVLKIACLPRGYRVLQIPILRYILAVVYKKLKDSGFANVIREWERANIIMGINFRHYDLINWYPGHRSHLLRSTGVLFQSHLLELRPYAYYSRKIVLPTGCTILEPSPVEGFLLRLTNDNGSEKSSLGKPYLMPTYFFTSENLLFSMRFSESTPPVPLELLISATNSLHTADIGTRLNELPPVFEQNPYPLDLESHIEWLNKKLGEEEFIKNDLYAFKCFNRRIIQILKSEALLDMTDIEEIHQGSADEAKSHELTYRIYSSARSTFWQTEMVSLAETAESIIFLRTKTGLDLKLMAPNPKVCKEWTIRLKEMLTYWKEKQNFDLQKMWNMKMRNITNLHIEEEDEANINGRTPKWVTDRGVADPTIYNVNALAVLRPLLYKGTLYQKPKKHAAFVKYMVILVPGFLILYNSYHRTKTGFAKASIDQPHYMTVPIENCYVYSGTLTELDLLDRSHNFDELNPGSHSLPRIYSDGWSSSETETSRCFTLWFGKKKFLSKTSKNMQQDKMYHNDFPHISDLKNEPQGSNAQNPNIIKIMGKLGVSGRSMVFMARSRQERDLWVLSLFYEMERLKNVN